MLEIKSWVLHL